MKSKFFKRVLCGAMALCMSAALISCGGGGGGGTSNSGNPSSDSTPSGGGDSSATGIKVLIFTGTATRNGAIRWATDAAKRFSELKKDETYEAGKKGVKITVQDIKDIPYATLSSDGNDIYVDEGRADMYTYSATKELMQLDEVVSYIENEQGLTIDAGAKKKMRGYVESDGQRHYYGLPHYEWYNSLTYDVDYWNEEGLYFARPDATNAVSVNGKFGSAKFVNPSDMKKSCGPDGKYGTPDDGLPSSLEEFAQVCAYIKSKGGSPFLIPGGAGGSIYSFHMVQAIWAALEGAETMRSITAEFSDKEVEVVTGFEAGKYFFGDKNIPMPITEKVVLNDDNGYKMYDMASRYYALAFMQLAYDEGWFHEDVNKDTSADAVQSVFIAPSADKSRAAMYIDGTYWYHEAQLYNDGEAFDNWDLSHFGVERKVSYMNLPSQLNGSVKENKGKQNTMLNVGSSLLFVNNQVSKNEGKKRAVLEFLKFLYSKQELAAFTEFIGMNIPINYDYNEEKLGDYYYTSFKEIKNQSAVITTASDKPVHYKNLKKFLLGFSGALNYFKIDGSEHPEGYLEAYRKNITAQQIFNGSKPLTESNWKEMMAAANK